MRMTILAAAATLALGLAGCQRGSQQQEQPAGESAAPGEGMQQEQTPGQQPGEAPDTQENVQPQGGSSGTMDQSSPGLGSGTDSSGQESQPSGTTNQ